jgi:hypothetical protein
MPIVIMFNHSICVACFIVMLSVIKPNVIMPSVIILSVVAPQVSFYLLRTAIVAERSSLLTIHW